MSWSPEERTERETRLKEAFERADQALRDVPMDARSALAERAVARYCALASCGLHESGSCPRSQLPWSDKSWDALAKRSALGDPVQEALRLKGEETERDERWRGESARWEAFGAMLKASASGFSSLPPELGGEYELAYQTRAKYAWVDDGGAIARVFVNPLRAARFLLESAPGEGGALSSGMTRLVCADSGKSIRSKGAEMSGWAKAVTLGIERAELEASAAPAARSVAGPRL